MTTGAIRGQGGTILSGEAMIALEECFHAIRRKLVLGVQALRSVAITANIRRNFSGRGIFQADDFMFRMAIGAGGGLAVTGGSALAMNTIGYVLRSLVV